MNVKNRLDLFLFFWLFLLKLLADLKDKYDGDENLLMQATVDDIRI